MTSPYAFNPRLGGTHAVIIDRVEPGSRVLDVGCAGGYLGRELAQRGCRVWGIDREADGLATLPPGYVDVAVIDLDSDDFSLPWSEVDFDCVIAADVLEHLSDATAALTRVTQQLRAGGTAIVSLPNVAHASVRLRLLAGRFDYAATGILDRTHRHLFTYRTARQLLLSTGISPVEELVGSDRFGRWLNGHAAARSVVKGLLAYSVILVGLKR